MGTDLTAWAETLSKFTGLLQLVYEDLAQPGVRQAGKALETVVGLGNTVLWPIALANDRARVCLQANMDRYRKKMEHVPEENVISVAPEIGVPVAEKLAYVSDDRLAELYTELLAQASNRDTVDKAHPSFVNVINNLSPDEAVLLGKLKARNHIAFVRALFSHPQNSSHNEVAFFPEAEYLTGLAFGQNFQAYLSNFSGLGLITIDNNQWLSDAQVYAPLEARVTEMFKGPVDRLNEASPPDKYIVLRSARGVAQITPFGQQFIAACVR